MKTVSLKKYLKYIVPLCSPNHDGDISCK